MSGDPDPGLHDAGPRSTWTFLTNHGHVMLCIARNPDVRISEIADLVGIGERAAHRIVQDLVDGGYVSRTRVGRRNVYAVDLSRPLRHPLEAAHAIGELFAPWAPPRLNDTARS